MVVQLEWSMDGNRRLALSENSSIRVFRMKVGSVYMVSLVGLLVLSLSLSPSTPPSLLTFFPSHHTIQTQCINNWVCANKREPLEEDKVIHVAWLDYRPMATIHHSKEDWREVMEFQPFNPQLRMLLGNAFIAITNKGKVQLC